MATDLHPPGENATVARQLPPFWITRVRIENYKSIKFCDVTLEPFTIFVGRNGAGKSNFFDALSFLADFVAFDLPTAIGKHGGAGAILHHGVEASRLSITCDYDVVASGGRRISLRHGVEIDGLRTVRRKSVRAVRGRATISGETLSRIKNGVATLIFDRERPTQDPSSQSGATNLATTDANHPPGVSMLRNAPGIHRNIAQYVRAMISQNRTYRFNPHAMRSIHRHTPGEALAMDGGNLAGVVYDLCGDPSTPPDPNFTRVEQYLNSAIPQLSGVGAHLVGSERVMLQFNIDGCQTEVLFDADQVSDGTLRTLASMTATLAPETSHYVPYVAIEEPETSVHPLAAHVLVAAFDEASALRQILITTHSPDILDAREVTPDRVRIV